MVKVIMRDGKTSVAGFVAVHTLLLLFWIMTMALARGTAIMIGQNYGAGSEPRRVARILATGMAFAACFGILMVVAASFMEPVLSIFVDSPEVIERAAFSLNIMKWSMLTVGLFQILLATYTATGKTRAVGIISITVDIAGLLVAFQLDGSGLENVSYINVFVPLAKAILFIILLKKAFWDPVVERARGMQEEAKEPSEATA
jgi:Na+-driven multidrug efflux pump